MLDRSPQPVWNHNTHYHNLLLRHLPDAASDALDVGCGFGSFASRVAERAKRVDALDVDADAIAQASKQYRAANLRFIAADFMDVDLPAAQYDFISSVASLHHMDMNSALSKMKSLLRPNGVLAILGLYRDATLMDHLLSVASFPISKTIRAWTRIAEEPNSSVRICEPTLTFAQIKRIALTTLPDARLRRRLFWRYTLFWCNRSETEGDQIIDQRRPILPG